MTDTAVQNARAALDEQIETARVVRDPMLPTLAALGEFARALERVEQRVSDFCPTLSDRDLNQIARSAAHGASERAGTYSRILTWRTLALACAVGFVLSLASFGAGWFARGDGVPQACVSRGVIHQEEKSGAQYCVIWLNK